MEKNEHDDQFAMRHTLAHILMQALRRLYPDAVPGVGPAIDDAGFYHDFDSSHHVSEDELSVIEKEMKKIIKEKLEIKKVVKTIEEAKEFFKNNKYIYTEELANELVEQGETELAFYEQGEFSNMCKGPHVENTGDVGAFKLIKVAGAYWRGDEKNKMLQRIYGIGYPTKEEVKEHVKRMEEAKKRDHRKLGKDLDLFCFSDLVGKGLPLLTPKGAIVRQELEKFIVGEETKRGYMRTYTPDLAKVDLYKKSGHWDHYKEDMYPAIVVDGEEFVLRPMTCPHQFMIYNSRPRSYRELPLRYAEIAKLYRKEKSGELTGLIRLMSFSLVDAHIICRPDQVKDEFAEVVDLVQEGMRVLGITDYWYRFSKWDPANKEKYVDNPKAWEETQDLMKEILDQMKLNYSEADDEAAFYGPKLDVQMRNVNGKEDTAFTIQIDFAMPEKFDMTYIDKEGKEQRPMIIHRSSIGCLERTMAFLIEHYIGAFPLWLSPVQVKLLPVGENHVEFTYKLAEEFKKEGIRVEVDDLAETIGKKVRNAAKEKIPYILVVGDKEMESNEYMIRVRGVEEQIKLIKEDFINLVKEKIEKRDNKL